MFIENKQLKLNLVAFCQFYFLKFTFDFSGFHRKKLKIIMIFELARGRKFSGEQ